MRIAFYRNTKTPVRDFIDAMGKRDQAKVLGCLKNIEDLGFNSPRVQFRQIRGKLWEIKIHAPDSGYRFFYICLHSNALVLLHAYKKRSNKAPNKEIAIAEKRLLEVLENESNYTK
jgi:phage-related protein